MPSILNDQLQRRLDVKYHCFDLRIGAVGLFCQFQIEKTKFDNFQNSLIFHFSGKYFISTRISTLSCYFDMNDLVTFHTLAMC